MFEWLSLLLWSIRVLVEWWFTLFTLTWDAQVQILCAAFPFLETNKTCRSVFHSALLFQSVSIQPGWWTLGFAEEMDISDLQPSFTSRVQLGFHLWYWLPGRVKSAHRHRVGAGCQHLILQIPMRITDDVELACQYQSIQSNLKVFDLQIQLK